MEPSKAKDTVIKAGKQLIENGLIVRTWGNVSCRISEKQFVITPSGLPYEKLTNDEIVVVNIEDLSFKGNVEPSSEKKVHAAVYKQRPDINFIIHTHQPYASALSPLGLNIPMKDSAAANLIGESIISILYAFSGTGELEKNVSDAVSEFNGKAYLMVSHGALCLGNSCDEAFEVASTMEQACRDFINQRYLEISDAEEADPEAMRELFVKKRTNNHDHQGEHTPVKLFSSERINGGFKLYLDIAEKELFPAAEGQHLDIKLNENLNGLMLENQELAAAIHGELYKKYPDIHAISQTLSPDVIAVSRTGQTVYPMLEDFAQIIGVKVSSVNLAPQCTTVRKAHQIVHKIKDHNAIMLKGSGALCCGPSKSDAAAVVKILDKNCKAVIASTLFSRGKPIKPQEARQMRENYLKHYAKKQ